MSDLEQIKQQQPAIMQERERRWLIPINITSDVMCRYPVEITNISQAYTREGRIRIINGEKAELTEKTPIPGQDSKVLEKTWELDVDEAVKRLEDNRIGAIIRKQRSTFMHPDGRHKVEMDVFCDEWLGLAIVEIELHDDDDTVEPLSWFGPEITGVKQLSNFALAIGAVSEVV